MNDSVIVEPFDGTTTIMDIEASDVVYRTLPSSSTSSSARNDRQTSEPSVIMIDDEETVLPSDDSIFTSGSVGTTNTNQGHHVSSARNVANTWAAADPQMSSQWPTSSHWSAPRARQQPQAASSRSTSAISRQAPEDDEELREALERIRQLEEDERIARQLQAEFDSALASHQQQSGAHNAPMDTAQPNASFLSVAAYSRQPASLNAYANPMQMHLQLQIATDQTPSASNSVPAPMGHFVQPSVTSNSDFVMFGPSTSSGTHVASSAGTMKRSNAAASNSVPPTPDPRTGATASTSRTRLRASRRSQLPAAQRSGSSSDHAASTSAAVSASYSSDMEAEQSMQRPDEPIAAFSSTGQYDAMRQPQPVWPLGTAESTGRTEAQVRADRRRALAIEETLEQVVAQSASSFDPASQGAQPTSRHREYAVASRRHRRTAGRSEVASSSVVTSDHSNSNIAASSSMNQFVSATPGPAADAFPVVYHPDELLGILGVSSLPARRPRDALVAQPDHAFVVRRGEAGASVMHIPLGLTRTAGAGTQPQWRIELHAAPNRMSTSAHAHAHVQAQVQAQAQANNYQHLYTYETLTRLTEALGDVSSGLSASRIAQLPTFHYTVPSQNAAHSNGNRSSSSTGTGTGSGRLTEASVDTECVICLSQFEQDEELRILTCLHKFHRTCIDPWLVQKGTCPTCRERPSV